jgi:hypothetical protein
VVFDTSPTDKLNLPLILSFDGKNCSMDFNSKMLRYSISQDTTINFKPYVDFQNYSSIMFNSQELENHTCNDLGVVKINQEYQVKITTDNEIESFSLTFTKLPIVQIVTALKVYDEPKSLGRMKIFYPDKNEEVFDSYIGLEYRGAVSQQYDKKSFGLSLLNSQNVNDKAIESVFGMSPNTDWILDAMYIDNSRLRNKVSFQIWKEMQASHYSLSSQFVELFVNNEHRGLYCFNENVNEILLHVNDSKGVIYKAYDWGNGATEFYSYSDELSESEYWDCWEQKYPKASVNINWNPLAELRNLVVNSSDSTFSADIAKHIDVENFIDYYLFLNLVSAMDNTGKNIFYVKTNETDLFKIVPWDLDGSWGIFYDGSYIGYTAELTNNIYKRLYENNPDDYRNRLKTRWLELRGSDFSQENLLSIFDDSFQQLYASDIIDVENQKWNLSIHLIDEQIHINEWIPNRLNCLDEFISDL